jgi:hypothetical protein
MARDDPFGREARFRGNAAVADAVGCGPPLVTPASGRSPARMDSVAGGQYHV